MTRQFYASLQKYVFGSLFIGICFFTAAACQAVSLQWDVVPTGGVPNGTWDAISSNWYNGSSDVIWSYGADAVFDSGPSKGPYTSGGTITVDSGGVVVENMTFNLGGYTLSGGPITLTGTPVITVTNAADTATINSSLSGPGIALTKSGLGTLVLGGSNTYDSGTTINTGTLEITNSTGTTSNGLGVGAVSTGASGTLWLAAASSASGTNLTYSANTITGTGTLKISAPNAAASTAIVPGDLSGFTGTIDINPYNSTVAQEKQYSAAAPLTCPPAVPLSRRSTAPHFILINRLPTIPPCN